MEEFQENTSQEDEMSQDDNSANELAFYKNEAEKYKALLHNKSEKVKELQRSGTGSNAELLLKVEKLELRTQGYNEDQIAFIMDVGGTKALEKESIKKAVHNLNGLNTDGFAPRGTSKNYNQSSSYTQSDFDNMSAAEMEKVLNSRK